VVDSQTRKGPSVGPFRLAAKRLARSVALATVLLLCGTAAAQAATGSIGAIGINTIESDGIMLPNDNWDGPGDLTLAQGVGIQLYRARIQLNCVDPNYTGTFDFTDPSSACGGLSYDQLVAGLAAHGMTMLPILINMNSNGIAVPPTTSGGPSLAEWSAFAAAAVARYGPSGSFWPTCGCTPEPIQAWEIWNEENNGYWWGGDASASGYATVFDATRTALRGVDPQARVVVGGLTYDPNGQSSFVPPAQMIQTLAAGNANAFDAVAVHPYTDAVGASPAALAQSAMDYVTETAQAVEQATGPSASGGPRQQIWVTEMGWSDSDAPATTIADGFQDFINDVNNGDRTQDNIGPVLWYMLRDNSSINSINDSLGLRYTNSDGSDAGPKPIWPIYASAAEQEGTVPLPPALADSGPYVAPTIAKTATTPSTKGSSGSKNVALRCTKVKRHGKKHEVCKRVAKKKARKHGKK
jgi:hypothetical protein